ncbi:unnamed protein product [Prunus armeniaca]
MLTTFATSPSVLASHSSSSAPSITPPELLASLELFQPVPYILVLSEQQLQVLLPSIDSISSFSTTSVQPSVPVESAPAGPSHSMLTRSKTGVVMDELSSYRVASFLADWTKAMDEEISALQMQGTWVLVPPPANTNIVGSKWIYKLKRHSDGSISRYKARLVAQGFSLEAGFDYEETFSPIVCHATIRIILSLAGYNHWSLHQLDVKNTFLHGELEEEVYMKQPQGFEDPHHPDYVCKLQKSLYGLKQAPRAWNAKFTGFLPSLGFKMSHSDPSLFLKYSDSCYCGFVTLCRQYYSHWIKSTYRSGGNHSAWSVFELKDMGILTYFLGLQISYKFNGDIFVSQQK